MPCQQSCEFRIPELDSQSRAIISLYYFPYIHELCTSLRLNMGLRRVLLANVGLQPFEDVVLVSVMYLLTLGANEAGVPGIPLGSGTAQVLIPGPER